MDIVKENLPAMGDDIHPMGVMSAKKPAQTPRQPLMDLKQVARPALTDGVAKMAAKCKPQTPLCTPKMKKDTRKFQPSSLVYVEQDKTELKHKLPDVDSIPEDEVSEFVTQVLERCVQDIQTENAQTSSRRDCQSQENQCLEIDFVPKHCTEVLQDNSGVKKDIDLKETDSNKDEDKSLRSTNTECVNVSTHDEATDLSLHENSLLGDTSQNSDCSESFTDSTKTEDELLASFSDNSNVDEKSPNHSSHCGEEETSHTSFNQLHKKEPTPRPSFLEKAALTHRVREASSSLATWVIPQDQMELHLQRDVEVGKVRLVHDMACSPIVVNDAATQSSKVNSREEVEVTENKVSDNDVENVVKTVTENIIANIIECEETKVCASRPSPSANTVEDEMAFSSESSNDISSSVSERTPIKSASNLDMADAIETKSAYCSPMPFSGNEVGVQSVVLNQSIMCSPFTIPVSNSSTQHEIEMQSVMCSPMPLSVCDISIQQEIETQSTMCSPMKIQVLDTSVQNVAETQSAVCSPMVPRPTHDKSVLVSGPESVEMGVGTEQVILMETGITVAPEMESVSTDMDDSPMTNSGTSMTPIKLGNKFGRKLTADDIRKQHPRVLANQLDTLMLENGRLEGLVRNMEKQAKKLQAQEELVRELEAERLSRGALQDLYDREVTDWQHKCDELEQALAITKLEHHDEIMKLKDEYEATDYRDHFLASQKLVSELQADLEQYNNLVKDIDQSQKLQSELGTVMSVSWGKLKTTSEKIVSMKQKLDEQVVELARQKGETTVEFASLEEQKAVLQSQRQEVTEMVAVYKDNMIELETKMETTSAELQAAQDKITFLETYLDKVNKENEDHIATKSTLCNDLEQSRQTEDKLNAQVMELLSALTQKTEELHSVNKSLTETSASQEREAADHRKAQEKSNTAIINLERTLDMREHDIDVMEKDLFECREIIYTQMESLKNLEAKDKATTAELTSVKTENFSLRDCCALLRGKEQELRASLESIQEELLGTKDHATRIIKKQGTEITDCFTALAQLTDHMKSVLTNLNQRAGIQKVGLNSSLGSAIDEMSQLGSSQVSLPSHSTKASHNSLVSQILHAAKSVEHALDSAAARGKQTSPNEEITTSNETDKNQSVTSSETANSPTTLSKQKPVHDENRAFVPVQSVTQSDSGVGLSASQEQMGQGKEHKSSEGIGKLVAKEKGENCLVPQVENISSLFTEVMRVAHLLEKALKSTLNDVREENDDLNCRMFQCEYAERRLHAELELRQSELTKNKAMIKQLQNNIDEMGERLGRAWDNQTEVKQLQLEIRNLRGKIQSLEGEKELLDEQMAELLQQIDAKSGSAGGTEEAGASRKEVMKLQKKLERYRAMQMDNDSRMEELSSKAARRIQKLEDNWRKADAEVCRLDEMVDVIRKELVSSETLRRDSRLQKLVNMIDGVEPVASSKNTSGDLKPVKTAKW